MSGSIDRAGGRGGRGGGRGRRLGGPAVGRSCHSSIQSCFLLLGDLVIINLARTTPLGDRRSADAHLGEKGRARAIFPSHRRPLPPGLRRSRPKNPRNISQTLLLIRPLPPRDPLSPDAPLDPRTTVWTDLPILVGRPRCRRPLAQRKHRVRKCEQNPEQTRKNPGKIPESRAKPGKIPGNFRRNPGSFPGSFPEILPPADPPHASFRENDLETTPPLSGARE